MIKVGSDFSGVGAFNQALMRLGIEYDEVFACDMDKYARQTFIHNYGEPKYYPKNVYEREIPKESLDIYMTSPPCQAFSLAGKRLGKEDKRGILFFNSHEFIKTNKPRYFIFENVKGLLSDDNGNTFKEWVNMLGGKSVNGLPVLFPYEDSVPYHIYYKVMNSKKHGVPQNRERVFIIGIRDDQDNTFRWAKEEHLTKRLKDVLEVEVLQKFYLSEKAIKKCKKSQANKEIDIKEVADISRCIVAGYYTIPFDGQYIKVSSSLEKYFLSEDGIRNLQINQKYNKFNPLDEHSEFTNTISARCNKVSNDNPFIKIKSATKKGYEEATEGDSINFSVPNSETRRGRVGKGVAQTLDTQCNQGTLENHKIRRLTPRECFRLMDFPDTFTWTCSDSQAYKQAGNSIVVKCLELIIKELRI
jgi:DNA (cytosine-5)-methyltransferase 1